MRKIIIIFSLILIAIGATFFYQLLQKEKGLTINHFEEGMSNPGERAKWELKRLADPVSGKIPEGIRRKELEFAKTLPKQTDFDRQYNWKALGPFNVGGRTRAAAVDVANENIIIAGSISGGIWRTVDGGNTWSLASTPDQNIGASCIAQDTRPGKENTWYIGSGERYNSASALAEGRATVPHPSGWEFPKVHGEVHIKGAHLDGLIDGTQNMRAFSMPGCEYGWSDVSVPV